MFTTRNGATEAISDPARESLLLYFAAVRGTKKAGPESGTGL